MNIDQAEKKLASDLSLIYEMRESHAMAGMVMEHITGYSKIDRIIHKTKLFSANEESVFQQYEKELLNHRPIQYVLGEAWFLGMRFHVNEKVLIPRPETEELVNWAVEDIKSSRSQSLKILDIGTGSGCIPVGLGKVLPSADIHSCDISPDAIDIARINALEHGINVDFIKGDFLDPAFRKQLPIIDYIISNPPYIPASERPSMLPHIINYEPSIALFVPDEDPLVFYHAIAGFAKENLLRGGKLFLELHVEASIKANQFLVSEGFKDVEIKADMQGIPRMIKATMLP